MAPPDTIRKLLKQLWPNAKGVRAPAVHAIRQLLNHLAMRLNGCHKMDRAEIRALLPGELGRHAVEEVEKALTKFEADAGKWPGIVTKTDTRTLDYMRDKPLQAAAVLEYIACEVLELAGALMKGEERVFLTLSHVHQAVFGDQELREMPGAAELLDTVDPDTLWELIAENSEPTPHRCRAFTEGRKPRVLALYRALYKRRAAPELSALLCRIAMEEAAVQSEYNNVPHRLGLGYVGTCAGAAVMEGVDDLPTNEYKVEQPKRKAEADALCDYLMANVSAEDAAALGLDQMCDDILARDD